MTYIYNYVYITYIYALYVYYLIYIYIYIYIYISWYIFNYTIDCIKQIEIGDFIRLVCSYI